MSKVMNTLEAAGLLERDRELDRIEEGVRRAASGDGGVLLIEGEPGIGKTSLLLAARELGGESGMRVLKARATELEREFAFGVVRQMLEPPLRAAGPAGREELLGGSASRARSVLGFESEGRHPVDPGFPTLHGLYWLLANLAERQPLLILLDDAQWADPDSLRFIAFLAPRLAEMGALLLIAARPGHPTSTPLPADSGDPLAESLQPGRLSPEATGDLLADGLGTTPDRELTTACHAATLGNPFLLVALIDELLSGGGPAEAVTPADVAGLGPRVVVQAVLARLARLAPKSVRLARVLAILGDRTRPLDAAELAGLELREVLAAAAELSRAAVLSGEELLSFIHPITRNAVYGDIARDERDALHRTAAQLRRDQDAPIEQVAAHLKATDPAGDSETVEVLCAAAGEGLARGAVESAVAYLTRAMAEPPVAAARPLITLQLGIAEAATDVPGAIEHLHDALELADDGRLRPVAAAALARILFFAGRMAEAIEVGRPALDWIGPDDGELRRRLEAVILAAACVRPSLWPIADEMVPRLSSARVIDDRLGSKALDAGLTYVEARNGELSADRAVEQVDRSLEGGVLLKRDNGRVAFFGVMLVLTAADHPRALPLLGTALARAREEGDLIAVAANRIALSRAHLVRGSVAAAIAEAKQGLAAARIYGVEVAIPWACGFLAAAQIELGDIAAAEETLNGLDALDETREDANWHAFFDSRVRLWAQLGNHRRALEEALEAGRLFEAIGGANPAFLAWRSQAALSLNALGEDPAGAARLAAAEVADARAWGAPRALGIGLRREGMIAPGTDGQASLHEAVEVLAESPARLEHAYALIELGAAVRRAGTRSAAREPLNAGLAIARECGAVALVERAYEEISATGARPRKILYTGIDSLTPSELRVARMAASGMTNREIAQSLFVTAKTVEFHLGQAYRKLSIRSRTEIETALTG